MSCSIPATYGLEMYVNENGNLSLKQRPFGMDEDQLIELTMLEVHWMQVQLDNLLEEMDKYREEKSGGASCPAA